MRAPVQKAVSFSKNYLKTLRLVWQTSPALTLLSALSVVLVSLVPASQTYLGKLIIDQVVGLIGQPINSQTAQPVLILVFLAFTLSLLEHLLKSSQSIFQDLLTDLALNKVNALVLEKAVTLDLSFFENSEFYDKLDKIRRESNYRPIRLLLDSFNALETAITAFSMLALLLAFGWIVLTLLVLVSLPRLFYNIRYSQKRYAITDARTPESRKAWYLSWLLSSDRNSKEIKLFNLGQYFIRQYQQLFNKFYQENKSLSLQKNLGDLALSGISSTAFYASYAFVVWQTLLTRFTVGDLTLYHRAFQSALGSFGRLLSRLSSIYEHNLYLDNLFEFLTAQPKIVSSAHAKSFPLSIQQGIELRGVSFKYPGEPNFVLENISLVMRPSQSIALVGKNGAGKTTLVKLLTRLYEPTQGQVLIDGVDYREIDLESLRQATGVIFQDFVAYQDKARENIGFGDLTKLQNLPEIIAAAQKSGAHQVIEGLPEKYETLLGKQFEGGHELSWGEWQKLALARGFFRDAQLLILDEPTASLDAEAEYELYQRFAQLAQERMVVLISHRFSTVRVAEKICVLVQGRLVEQGSHDQLMQTRGEYARLFNLQAEGYR